MIAKTQDERTMRRDMVKSPREGSRCGAAETRGFANHRMYARRSPRMSDGSQNVIARSINDQGGRRCFYLPACRRIRPQKAVLAKISELCGWIVIR
jgi:hypothetical protein